MKKKPSEIFEGPNSSLRKTFDATVASPLIEKVLDFENWLIHQPFCDVNKRGIQVCDSNCKNVFNGKIRTALTEAITQTRREDVEIGEKIEFHGPDTEDPRIGIVYLKALTDYKNKIRELL